MGTKLAIHALWADTLRRGAMVGFIIVVSLLALHVAQPPVTASSPPGAVADLAAIDRYVTSEMQAARLPGLALAIVQGNRIVHLKGFGIADPSGRPVTPETPFIIGSTGKSITAMAIMQLVEAGKVDLRAPVQHYLPWFRVADPEASARITVRHLLSHTSGIPTPAGLTNAISRDASDTALEERVRSLAAVELTQGVGATFQYSNANYETLGLIVQVVSGQSYEEYVQEHIFAPLDMQNSFLFPQEARQHGAASGHRYWFGVPLAFEMPYHRGIVPAGFIFSSAEDMAHYLIAHLNGGQYRNAPVLSPTGIAELHRSLTRTSGGPITAQEFYAMGWFIREKDGLQTVSHAGSTPHFHANLVLVPEGQWGIVLLMNAENGLRPEQISGIARGVTTLLVGREPWDVSPRDFFPTLLTYVLIGVVIQALGMIRSVVLLHRWRRNPQRRRSGWLTGAWHVVLPLVLNLLWALLLLVAVPRLLWTSLSDLRLFVPDFGATLLMSGGVALGWAILRTILVIQALRSQPTPVAVSVPAPA